MALNTVTDLKGLLGYNGDADLRPYLDTAAIVVSEDLAGKGLTSNRQKLVENYLAAHFATIALFHGGLTSQEVGDSVEDYNEIWSRATGLNRTNFGQQAILLDTSGTLATKSKALPHAEFRVV